MSQWYYRRPVIRNRGSLAQAVILQKDGVVHFKGILKDINIRLDTFLRLRCDHARTGCQVIVRKHNPTTLSPSGVGYNIVVWVELLRDYNKQQALQLQWMVHTFPGFMIPSGSIARLIIFISPTVPSPSSSTKNSFFPIPTPCSPVPGI